MDLFVSVCVCVCVSVCLSVTFVRIGGTLATIKSVNNDVVDFYIFHRIAKIVLCDLDLFFECQRIESTHFAPANAHTIVTSAGTGSNRDLATVANSHSSVTSARSSVKAIFAAKQITRELVTSVHPM